MMDAKASTQEMGLRSSEDQRAIFQGFIDRLSIKRPKELVLIQPALVPERFFDVTTARRGGYYNFPPVGLLYLAAAAREIDPELSIHIIDVNHEILKAAHRDNFQYGEWRDLVAGVLDGCEAPHIGMSYMFGTTKPCFIEIASFIRENNPEVPLLTGGVQATYDYEEILKDGLSDLVVRKEGEVQLQNILRSCITGQADHVPTGAALVHSDEVVELGVPPTNVPMDWDIQPTYQLIDIDSYHYYGGLGAFSRYMGEDKRYATVLSTRGCRARCTFCTVRDFNGFGLRQRTVQHVIDEIKFLIEHRGVRYIDWLDDDLLWDPARTEALFRGLAEQVPGLEWTASNGLIAVAVTEEIMKWMVKSGLKAFKIGVESGNDKMLKVIKKPATKPKLREKRKLFAKYPEVLFSANFIIGFPNETFGEMIDTYNFAGELECDWASFYICQPLKGTEIFSSFQALGDDRCEEERYDKTINPGRSAERGEFGYRFAAVENEIKIGWEVFDIPRDAMPGIDQQKEIWFTFNFVCNFLYNPNFRLGSNLGKIIRWIEAIRAGYPYDASMVAALAHAYRLAGEVERFGELRDRFHTLSDQSDYWQQRVHQFPEMLLLAGVEVAPSWFTGVVPTEITRTIPGIWPAAEIGAMSTA